MGNDLVADEVRQKPWLYLFDSRTLGGASIYATCLLGLCDAGGSLSLPRSVTLEAQGEHQRLTAIGCRVAAGTNTMPAVPDDYAGEPGLVHWLWRQYLREESDKSRWPGPMVPVAKVVGAIFAD